jgi:hypothetical protein
MSAGTILAATLLAVCRERRSRMARQRRGGTKKVGKVMREFKTGTLKSSSGAKVRKRKQAIAIALSEARQAGAKIPKKRAAAKKKKRPATKR